MKTKLFLTLFLCSFLIIKAQIPTNGLTKVYTFTNGSVLVNSANPGTYNLTSSVVTYQSVNDPSGTANQAINLNGSNLNGGQHPTGTGDFSYSFWIKTNSTSNIAVINQITPTPSFDAGFQFFTNNGKLTFAGTWRYGNNYSTETRVSSNIINDGNWHHIVVTGELINTVGTFNSFNKYNYKIYQDGALIQSVDTTNIVEVGGLQVFLFSNTPNLIFQGAFQGNLDNFREYTRLLTATEIADLFNEFTLRGPQTIYVDKDASLGANDGSSWADAFTDLQTALDNTINGDEVWVADGVYRSSIPATTSASVLSAFYLNTPGVSLFGGFNGTESLLSERVINTNTTILSGDVSSNDQLNFLGRTDNTSSVLRITASNTIIDGITIQGGNASYSGEQAFGSGIFKLDNVASLTVKNCVFQDNFCTEGGSIRAFFSVPTGGLKVMNCIFRDNVARYGAGIYAGTTTNAQVIELDVLGNLFYKNTATDTNSRPGYSGSAMFLRTSTASSVLNVNIINNTIVDNIDNGTNTALIARSPVGVQKDIINSILNVNYKNNISWDNQDATGVNATHISNLTNGSGLGTVSIGTSLGNSGFVNNVPSGYSISNVFTATPQFVNSASGDYSLSSTSLMIDLGDNTAVPAILTTDILGNQRIFNTTVDLGAYEFGASPLSINNYNASLNKVKLYPNPTTSFLNIEMKFDLKQAKIYSVLGAEVLNTTSKTINTTGLTNGVYLIKIEDEFGNTITKRFLKQ